MRFVVLLVLWSSVAQADTRLDVHVGGGLEGGLIPGTGMPSTVGEFGIGAAIIPAGKSWGLGLVLERVERPVADVPIGDEYKLDLLVRFASKRRVTGGVGAGLRKLAVSGEPDRKGSTLWGVDLVRTNIEIRIVRLGRVNLDAYFAWTFGLYTGEVYGTRYGDMPYPTRDYSTMASSYVLGLQTSFDTQP